MDTKIKKLKDKFIADLKALDIDKRWIEAYLDKFVLEVESTLENRYSSEVKGVKVKFEKSMFENHNPNPDGLKTNKNLLVDVDNIINDRRSEKAKEYGNFHESMASAALIASEITNLEIDAVDFHKCMIALKMARLKYSGKYDTYMDLVAYTTSLNNLERKNEK